MKTKFPLLFHYPVYQSDNLAVYETLRNQGVFKAHASNDEF